MDRIVTGGLLVGALLLFSGCHTGSTDETDTLFDLTITLQCDTGVNLNQLHYYLFEYPGEPVLDNIRAIYPGIGPAEELVTLPALLSDFEGAITAEPDNNELIFTSLVPADYVLWVEGNTIPTQRFLMRQENEDHVIRIRSGALLDGLNLLADTTLTTNIYEVTADIVVGEGALLTIGEGSQFRFAPGCGITVAGGGLRISSSAGQPVLFLGREEIVGDPQWSGIRLQQPLEPFQLDRALFMHADTALVFSDAGSVSLTHCLFVDNGCGVAGEGDFQLTNLRFSYNSSAAVLRAGTLSLEGSILLLLSECGVQTANGCGLQLANNWFESCYRALDIKAQCRGTVLQNVFNGSTWETMRLETPDSLAIARNTFHATALLDIRLQLTAEPLLYVQENNLMEGNILNPIVTVVSHDPNPMSLDFQYNYWHTTDLDLIESHIHVTGNAVPDLFPLEATLLTDAGPWGSYPYSID